MNYKRSITPSYDAKQKRFKKGEVSLQFEDPSEIEQFMELVNEGGSYKSNLFWQSDLVVELRDNLHLRVGRNEFSNKLCYYIRRKNQITEKTSNYSYVELERKYFPQFAVWVRDRLSEVDKLGEDGGLIKFLQDEPELASLKKDDEDYAKRFYDEKVTLVLGDFRVRPYYSLKCEVTLFAINKKIQWKEKEDWNGPSIWLKISEMREILAELYNFENRF